MPTGALAAIIRDVFTADEIPGTHATISVLRMGIRTKRNRLTFQTLFPEIS